MGLSVFGTERAAGTKALLCPTKIVEAVFANFGLHSVGEQSTDNFKHRIRRVCRITAMVQVNSVKFRNESVFRGIRSRPKRGDTLKGG